MQNAIGLYSEFSALLLYLIEEFMVLSTQKL
jgi:hypothetical protein